MAFCPASAWLNGLRMEGSMTVFLSPLVASPVDALPAAASTPPSLCHAFVTLVRRPMSLPLSNSVAIKMAQRFRCACSEIPSTNE